MLLQCMCVYKERLTITAALYGTSLSPPKQPRFMAVHSKNDNQTQRMDMVLGR